MSQVDLDTSIGYALKRAAWALRIAMEAQLRELNLSVSQYACLTLLAERPGLSNADLARGVFVTRQATHQLLSGLTQQGLIAIDGEGRAQRLSLTKHGQTQLRTASATVAGIEEGMLRSIPSEQRSALLAALQHCADALE